MSSTTSTTPEGQPPGGYWPALAPYLVPPAAASAAIVPCFFGFVAKSALQLDQPVPRMSAKEALWKGCKAAPTIGTIVGTQLVSQNVLEAAMSHFSGKTGEKSSFEQMVLSSALVGAVSAPALAVFNGQTRGFSARESLRKLSPKQVGAIVTRETSFLFSLRISDALSAHMKNQFGESQAIDFSCAFLSGAVGSVVGHPADTALTRWQENLEVVSLKQATPGDAVKAGAVDSVVGHPANTALTRWQENPQIVNLRQVMRGGTVKAVAVGGFSVFYKLVKDYMS